MGVIHQQGRPMGMTDRGQSPCILHPAQVVGAGQVDAEGAVPRLLQSGQSRIQGFRGHRAGAEAAALPVCRGPQPADIEIQQGRSVQQSLVGIPGRQQHRSALPRRGSLKSQEQHGPDALGRTLGPIKGARGAEQPGGIGLALGNDPLRLIQLVRPGDLGQIPGLTAQRAAALVPRHMQPGYPCFGIGPDKIRKRGGAHSHPSPSAQAVQAPPTWMGTSMPWAARSWFSATWIMMAHSIRFLNSSQPYSYTPEMLPVAW